MTTTTTPEITTGTKIYYTGDMANIEGIFTVTRINPGGTRELTSYDLTENDGDRTFRAVWGLHIGHTYNGTCNPRFVTLEARNTYRAKQIEMFRQQYGAK